MMGSVRSRRTFLGRFARRIPNRASTPTHQYAEDCKHGDAGEMVIREESTPCQGRAFPVPLQALLKSPPRMRRQPTRPFPSRQAPGPRPRHHRPDAEGLGLSLDGMAAKARLLSKAASAEPQIDAGTRAALESANALAEAERHTRRTLLNRSRRPGPHRPSVAADPFFTEIGFEGPRGAGRKNVVTWSVEETT
jgi:hypothetical protein